MAVEGDPGRGSDPWLERVDPWLERVDEQHWLNVLLVRMGRQSRHLVLPRHGAAEARVGRRERARLPRDHQEVGEWCTQGCLICVVFF